MLQGLMKTTVTAALVAAGALAAHSETGTEPLYSWQQPHATVLPSGRLEWAPRPFVFEKGESVRYIDFETGDDSKDGKTQQTAWKRHPGDANATGEAKACKGIQTYIFKGGVVYRGALTVPESGAPENPIRLTRDPAWGKGDATFNGSMPINGGWKKATAEDAPGVPKPELVWYQDIGQKKAASLWQVEGSNVTRMHIARWPNYDGSDPDDPVKGWPFWTAYDIKTGRFTAPELKGLGDTNHFDGATIWSEGVHLMASAAFLGTPLPGSYDPVEGSVLVPGRAGNREMDQRTPKWSSIHVMFENTPRLLDAPGEFYYDAKGPKAGRLYLIPAGGVDPNRVRYELAQTGSFIRINDQHDVVISGLEFRHNDPEVPSNYGGPCVSILGNCSNITVKNCAFYYVSGAVSASFSGHHPEGHSGNVLDNIIVSDNDIQHVEKSGAIYLYGVESRGPGRDQLKHVEVMRNRLFDTGFRHGTVPWGSLPAIHVRWPETCEIAGNIVDRSLGNGIITFGGKGNGAGGTVPLTRFLVHHNQLDNTMLGCNDYGGLEHFQGGPAYLYNNNVYNAIGNRNTKREIGYNIYLDGGFKCYLFNNVAAGKIKPDQPDYYNHAGYFMVAGYLNQFFNNTLYHFIDDIKGNSGNRCNILGNVLLDCKNSFIFQNHPGDVSMEGGNDTGESGRIGIPTMAYASNVFFGKPKEFASVAGISKKGNYDGAPIVSSSTIEELRQKLLSEKCRLATVGWHVTEPPLINPAGKDYRPATNSAVKERGVKYFVPWALARTVGEWNFFKSTANPGTVLGDGFYMTDEYGLRDMYYFMPRQDLTVSACSPDNYVTGPLEDWTEGALAFDGKERVATLTHAEMTKSMDYPAGKGKTTYDGSKRETVNMGTNSFLVEVFFKVDTAKGVLASKLADSGYQVSIGPAGAVCLTIQAGGAQATVASTVKVNDGKWHHVIAEADRAAGKAAIYVDGRAAGDGKLDAVAKDATLANTADFVVGKEFVGAIDFLRVCRSTLAESKTTIDELYAWEFNGPFLRDFCGRMPPDGRRRDAGALQAE